MGSSTVHRKIAWVCGRSAWQTTLNGAAAPWHRRTGAGWESRWTEPLRRL